LLESTHDFPVDHTCGNTKDNVRLTFDWSSSDVTTGMNYFTFLFHQHVKTMRSYFCLNNRVLIQLND